MYSLTAEHPEISINEIFIKRKENIEVVKRSSCSLEVQPLGGQGRIDQFVHSSRARQGFMLSHDVLVQVRLAVVGCCEGAQPGYREWMAEHHLHIHPL